MGWTDKLKNKKDETKGAAKEQLGKATDDEQMEREGQIDQTKSNLKQAGREGQGRPKQGLRVGSDCLYADSAASRRDRRSSITMAPIFANRTGNQSSLSPRAAANGT
jgi:uncharacterized protein YjbJ (UPF0337 family)